MSFKEYTPGTLVTLRGRDWIVQPSGDEEILLVKPLGGSEDELTGIYLPLLKDEEKVEITTFPRPQAQDLSDFESAKLLYDASRLAFRNAAGPFRCMGKLSFRPRSYQIVPLVLALKQNFVRLLIADDVGIGKTIEALLILKELLERGDIRRFAVICLPHLCDQWQSELKDKLDIDAEIIRSSTAASLDRKLTDDRSIFYHTPYQVISVDYIKSDRRIGLFLEDCPELVIVDEVHTCARPAGTKSVSQQQRHNLIHKIASRENQHLLMLTATPHSGKDPEFLSLLGLLKPDFEKLDLNDIQPAEKKKLASHFIQRKRENLAKYLDETTPFPERNTREIAYKLTAEYASFYNDMLRFARGLSKEGKTQWGTKIRYWAALALLRGVMSSPEAGLEMLKKRDMKAVDSESPDQTYDESEINPVIEKLESDSDVPMTDLVDFASLSQNEKSQINELSKTLSGLSGKEKDNKLGQAVKVIKEWLNEGYNPIIFCRYIATAEYVGRELKKSLLKTTDVQVITSTLSDDQRKERILEMNSSEKRVLVATDCLSEGINLQDGFNAVLHYDLPWNPNRLEQREGRVDRFGQKSRKVLAYLLWGEDNPIDVVVLRVLIRKIRDIQKSIGVSIAVGEDNRSIANAVLNAVLLNPASAFADTQMSLFRDQALIDSENMITGELELQKKKAVQLKNIFAHSSIDDQEIKKQLSEVDEIIGSMATVEDFVKAAVVHLGGKVERHGEGWLLYTFNLPLHLKSAAGKSEKIKISFDSPTPEGYRYIGRNHRFTELLCQFIIALAFEQRDHYKKVARASVMQTEFVKTKTTLIQFRVRNLIRESGTRHNFVAEEMYLWGYVGSSKEARILSFDEAKQLLTTAVGSGNLSVERQENELEKELRIFSELEKQFDQLAERRAENLVKAHMRFKKLVGGTKFEKVLPVLPPDIMGVYVLIPKPITVL